MIPYKYGSFTGNQIAETKENMRKQIYFLLCIADPNKAEDYDNVDISQAFRNVLRTFGGLNDLLNTPKEFVTVMSLLDAAYLELQSDEYEWRIYRKLLLDAGSEVLKIKEVG